MAASKFVRSGRYWLWAALFLSTTVLLGCNPQTLNFLLMPFVDDKEQPECKLTSPEKKEVSVAIVTTFASLETRPEMLSVEAELCDRLASEMRKLAKVTKEKITFIPSSKVRSFMSQEPSATLSRQEIGQKLKADYVINLEINSMSLYEKGSSNQLYHGRAEISVTCIDANKPHNESSPFQKIYSREYPSARGPVDASSCSIAAFTTQFLTVMAEEIAHYFVAYPSDFNRRMD